MRAKDIVGMTLLGTVVLYQNPTQSHISQEWPIVEPVPRVEIVPPQPSLEELTLEAAAERLNEEHQYGLSAEDLVYVARVLYFEGAFDKKASSEEDIATGYEAMASVILNRYLWDREHGTTKFGKENTLRAVVEKPYAFSCRDVPKNKELFEPKTFKNKKGEWQLAYGRMHPDRVELAYDALLDVLDEAIVDPTDGAMFYKADYAGVRWENTHAFSMPDAQCYRTFGNKINTHEFFVVECRPFKTN